MTSSDLRLLSSYGIKVISESPLELSDEYNKGEATGTLAELLLALMTTKEEGLELESIDDYDD